MTMRPKVSPNHRFIVTEDGSAFFYLGDTAWRLLYRLDRGQVDHYLQDRADKGFNAIQMVVFDMRFQPNRSGHSPYQGNDPTQPNEEFFAHLDWVVERCEQLGMFAVILPNWGYIVTARSPGGEHFLDSLRFVKSNLDGDGAGGAGGEEGEMFDPNSGPRMRSVDRGRSRIRATSPRLRRPRSCRSGHPQGIAYATSLPRVVCRGSYRV